MLQTKNRSQDHQNLYEKTCLVSELNALYTKTKAKMGDADLEHIRHIAAYSQAIKQRSDVLITQSDSWQSWYRGIVLGALHTLLEFSELGHNIMHGSFDHLPNAGEFHSERWLWNFVTDPHEWKVMHHQNHHPFTNIVGKDHDMGYSFLRALAGQNWYAHHSVQTLIYFVLLLNPAYVFPVYTAASAASTEGRKILSKATFTASAKLIKHHILENYFQKPFSAPLKKIIPIFTANYLKSALGYGYTFQVLLLEHHANNVEVFQDSGRYETQEEYFIRQIKGTTNFRPYKRLDDFFKKILEEEVPFANRPDFRVFYGGLDTHLEHHIFPDLACHRQREIQPEVERICTKYGLPYNILALEDIVPAITKNLVKYAVPIGEHENNQFSNLIKKPKELLKRIKFGLKYQQPEATTYQTKPEMNNISANIISISKQLDDRVSVIKMLKPKAWENISWDAGAYISLQFEIEGETYIRQYSVLADSNLSKYHLEIAVKRVEGGIVSNFIHDALSVGDVIRLVNKPQSTEDFAVQAFSQPLTLIAAGVGITPILSMLRKYQTESPDADLTLLYFNHDKDSIL